MLLPLLAGKKSKVIYDPLGFKQQAQFFNTLSRVLVFSPFCKVAFFSIFLLQPVESGENFTGEVPKEAIVIKHYMSPFLRTKDLNPNSV